MYHRLCIALRVYPLKHVRVPRCWVSRRARPNLQPTASRLLRLLARLPDLLGRRGHVEVGAGAAGNGVGDGVHQRGYRGGGAAFACALDSERIGRGRHVVQRVLERRYVVGARHRIVHERAGHELPARGVEHRILHHCLAEPLHDRAVGLAFDDHAVEHVAAVIDRRIGDELELAGGRIDLDLGNVATVREGQRRLGCDLGVEVLRNLAALLHLLGARGEIK